MRTNQNFKLSPLLSLAFLVPAGLLSCSEAATSKATPSNSELRQLSSEKVALKVAGKTFTISLYDNPTAKDLLIRLPMTIKANNYPGYDEKVLRLSKGLSMKNAPAGDNPLIPEVGYYQPGQWIALYYSSECATCWASVSPPESATWPKRASTRRNRRVLTQCWPRW